MALAMKLARDDLDSYREFVAAAAGTAKVIINRDNTHAAILMTKIFALSQQRVDILTDELSMEVFGQQELVSAAIGFLSRNTNASIQIAVGKPPHDDHPLWQQVGARGLAPRFHVFYVPEDLRAHYNCQMLIGDSLHFWFQPRRGGEAFVRFSDEEQGKLMQSAFDEILARVQKRERAPAWPLGPA
jgi:hypothetical protein